MHKTGDRRMETFGLLQGQERRHSTADRRQDKNLQYATFYIDEHFLGIAVLQVQEVLTAQPMTRVPLSSRMIGGLINLRGQIVTAIDLRTRLGFPARPGVTDLMNVVVKTPEGACSLLVDRIEDVIEVNPDLFEPPPEILDKRMQEVTLGVYKLKDRLLIVVNTEAVIQA